MKNKKYLIILWIFTSIYNVACSQGVFKKQGLPIKYRKERTFTSLDNNGVYVDLTTYLPRNFSVIGDVDYTKFIQKGLNENRKVKFPNFPILVNDVGLTVKSNSELIFDKNSQLKLKASPKERYEILRLHNVSNVKILNATIVGDRSYHKGSGGEWGMGIALRGSTNNVTLTNVYVNNCWGDGIYIGHLNNKAPQNIKIISPIIDNCRRNGISITTGRSIKINNALISNINGTAPESGIVIEPSNSKAIFQDIEINNAIVYNVAEVGIKIAGFEKLLGNSTAVRNISINKPVLDKSRYGMFVGRIRGENVVRGAKLNGEINIINPVFTDTRENSFVIRKQSNRGPLIKMSGVNEGSVKRSKNDAKEVVIK